MRLKTPAPALQAYVSRHALDASAFRSDGSLSLLFDDRYPVSLRPLSGERFAMLSPLLYLDGLTESTRDELLVRVMRYAAATVRDHACALVIEPSPLRLLLQGVCVLLEGGVSRLEEELAEFVDALAFWHAVCRKEAGHLQDVVVAL